MLDAFQEDGELSLKKFPELAQLRQAVKFLVLDLGTNPVSTTKPDSTTKVQQPLDWGDDEHFLFEFCRCVFVFLLLLPSFEWSFKRGRELEEACSRTMAEVLSSGKCPWCLLSIWCFFSFTSVLSMHHKVSCSISGICGLRDTQYTKQQLHDFASSAIISLKPVICELHFVCFACSSLHSCQDLSVSLIDCWLKPPFPCPSSHVILGWGLKMKRLARALS